MDTDAIKGATAERPQSLNTKDSEVPEEIQQDGVQIADAVTTTWTRKHLIVAYTRWVTYGEDLYPACQV